VDEFAVYTNSITDIAQHYTDGTSGGAGAYFHDVTNDNPVIYLRMDAPAYTAPDVSTWPVVTNHGSVGVNGVYTPGTIPGILSGPASSGVASFGGTINNSALLSGVSSFADVGYASAYDPTGSNANFTVTAMFRGNPCDGRIQSIVGHGTNSWQLGLTTNGCLVFNAGNGHKAAGGTSQAAGDIKTTGVYNDGNWHQVVAVNSTNVISIYVDGALDTNGTPGGITATNTIPGNPGGDVMIGSDPTYTNNPVGKGRSFAGRVCDVAFFPGALTAGQVQTLYNASGVVPSITRQPVSGRVAIGGPGTFINFGVNTTGSSLSYQWYFNTSSNFTGATPLVDDLVHYANSTAAQVTVTNLTSADSGYYFVAVTNNYGAVTSILASLTVANLDVWRGNINNSWDIATTANWALNGGSSVFNNGDAVQFDDSASLFNVNLAANVSPAGITVTNNRNAYMFSGTDGILAGPLVKTGTNTLTLAVADSSSGGITISAGTLIVGDGTTNGAVTAGSIADNSALEFAGTNGSCTVPISGSGFVEVNAANNAGNGVYTLGGLNSYLGNTIVSSGMLNIGSVIPALPGGGIVIVNTNAVLNVNGQNLTVNGLSGNGVLDNQAGAAVTFTVGANNVNSTFAGTISNTVGLVSPTKTGSGTLILTATNYFTGVFTFGGGIVNVASFSDYSDAPTPNAGPSALGERASSQEVSSGTGIGLEFNGGTLQYTGSTPQETDRQIRLLNTTSTIDASGSNPGATLYWSWGDVVGVNVNLFNTTGARTLQLTGSNTGTNTFDIQVTDQGANGTAVTKSGVGTWYMFGASAASPPGNAYSGATTISGGTLVISSTHNDSGGSAISANGLGTFTVSDGGTLGVTDGNNSEPALMKTLTVGSSAGATLEFLNIPASGVPMIKATNTAFHGNSTIVCSTNNLRAGTVYPLLAYGALSGSFSLAAMPGPFYYKLTNDTVNIDLVASATPLVNLNPTNIVFSAMNNQLILSWPADHTGWTLQAQTNSLAVGINTNWVSIPGSSSVDSVTNPINLNNGCVFYRLVYP
jgi:autotransporter-associated beta strand protein